MIRQNTLIADTARYIHYLGLLDRFDLLADLGYLGLVADDDVPPESLPYRKPRRSKKCPDTALADVQRSENVAHARRRVKVEHAISGTKRLGCVAQTCRNKSASVNDRLLALACRIWNWQLKKRKEPI